MNDLWAMTPWDITYKSRTIMGKTFDPAEPEAYVSSFPIGKG